MKSQRAFEWGMAIAVAMGFEYGDQILGRVREIGFKEDEARSLSSLLVTH